jgi:chloramphenicol O-acetyltransferase type B
MSILTRLKRLLSGKKKRTGLIANDVMVLIAEAYPQYDIGPGSYGDLEVLWGNAGAQLKMGGYCSVAKGAQVMLGGEHRPDWVTTYPFSLVTEGYRDWPGHPRSKGDVIIGNDVWICHGAMILSGVTIGDGAVIGARALVARDVPPYAIVSGNPARVIKMRFPEDIVARLLTLKWWDWPQDRIARAIPMLLADDITAFLDAAETGKI